MRMHFATYVILFTLLFIVGCAASKVARNGPVGAWEYTVKNTPSGSLSGTMNIMQEGEAYSGNLTTSSGTIDLNNVSIEDDKLSSTFNYQGTPLELTGSFSEDTFTGSVDGGGQTFPVEATRAN